MSEKSANIQMPMFFLYVPFYLPHTRASMLGHGASVIHCGNKFRSLPSLRLFFFLLQREYEAAQLELLDALGKHERVLGDDHPQVARDLHDWAVLLYNEVCVSGSWVTQAVLKRYFRYRRPAPTLG